MSLRERETCGAISPASLAANKKSFQGEVASPLSKDYSLDNFVVNRSVNVSLNNNNQQDDDTDTSDSETKPLFEDYNRTVLDEGSSKLVRRKQNEMVLKEPVEPKQIRCDCHEQPKPADTAARNRLMIACVVVLIFMIGEVVG